MYEEFASVYDEFMTEVPYAQWADTIEAIWKKDGKMPELVCDLACGTGSLTAELAKRGYDMIGIDQSADMLFEAQTKTAEASDKPILFLQQSMQEFELYGTVDSIVCTCDSINYLTDIEDLTETFRLVNNYLNPGGLFIFDVNTEHKFRDVIGSRTQSEVFEDAAYIWDNTYDEQSRINTYAVTFFAQHGEDYRRFDELHEERAYSTEEIKDALAKAGLHFVAAYDDYSEHPMNDRSERVVYIAREFGKETCEV